MLLGNIIGVVQSCFHEENQHAYLGSWIQALKSDKNEIFKAAGAAQSISDWLVSHAVKPEVKSEAVEAETPEMVQTEMSQPAAKRRMRM